MGALKKMNRFGALFFSIILLFLFLEIPGAMGDSFIDTTLSISPISQTVDTDESFTVDVYCVPGQPIKAYELRLSFDASLLQVDSVVEGDIFNGFSCFFNDGTIDNINGSIVNIYSLIIGPGNVSDSGIFVTITFTAKDDAGNSVLDFLDVGSWTGVTNETGYVPLVVNSGNVIIEGSSSPPNPPPPPPPYYPPPGPLVEEENHPPVQPMIVSGPKFVEMQVEYSYSSSTFDLDGDKVRFMFDWGDGSFSDWSDFVDSNTSVSMVHYWDEISVYTIRVIAQDSYGLNSSWSEGFDVTVSQLETGMPPVAVIIIPKNVCVNKTIIFDASDSYDPDGVIVSFMWDFGDGCIAYGVNPSHVYKKPGSYRVTLIVTDNYGNTYNESFIVTAGIGDIGIKGEDSIVLSFNFIMLITGIVIVSLLFVVMRRNKRFYYSLVQFHNYNLLHLHNFKIKRLKRKLRR